MNCSDVNKQIKSFLEDLLSEDECQGIHAHLDGCESCRKYVRGIGSLSEQLKELGEVDVPQDLSGSILFALKHPQSESEEKKKETVATSRKSIMPWAISSILAVAVVFFSVAYLRLHSKVDKNETAPAVTAEVIQEKEPTPSSQEAKVLFEKLKTIANTLEPAETKGASGGKTVQETTEKTPSPSVQVPASVSKTEEEAPPLESKHIHWHFAYEDETERMKLLRVLNEMNIPMNYSDQDILIFSASETQLRYLLNSIQSISRRAARGLTLESSPAPNEKRPVSIFLQGVEDAKPYTLHWDLQFSLPNRSKLIEVVHQLGQSVDYESEEVVVLSVSTTKLGELMDRVKAIEGIEANFGKVYSEKNSLLAYSVHILVEIKEV